MGLEGEPGGMIPIVAVKERAPGMIMASEAPHKTSGTFVPP